MNEIRLHKNKYFDLYHKIPKLGIYLKINRGT